MNETLILLINKLYNLVFTTNTFADKKHEDSVENILKDLSLNQIDDVRLVTILRNGAHKNKIVKELVGISGYLTQPFGSQNPPDFIVLIDGFVLWIECKSGKSTITWNTGYPTKDTLYVFSCKKRNTTTIFFGQLSEIQEKNENFEIQYREIISRYREELGKKFDESFITDNFDLYLRPMLNDKTKYSNPFYREMFYRRTLEIFSPN